MDQIEPKTADKRTEWIPTGTQALLTVLGIPVHLNRPKIAIPALVTWSLFALMLIGTILPMEDHDLAIQFGFIPARVNLYAWFTAIFIHAGILHFVANAYALIMFGRIIEIAIGPSRYLRLFFASGLAGNLLCSIFDPHSTAPHVGASGAIFGMLVFSLLKYRSERFGIFFLGTWIQISSVWLLLVLLPMQIYGAVEGYFGTTDVAYLGHLGGAIIGAIWAL